MSIAERLSETREDGPPWQTCSVQWVKTKITEEEQSALETLIAERTITFHAISKIIKEEVGISVNANAISRHCRSLCKCEVSK
jgi:transposase